MRLPLLTCTGLQAILRGLEGVGPRCLEFVVLTACPIWRGWTGDVGRNRRGRKDVVDPR